MGHGRLGVEDVRKMVGVGRKYPLSPPSCMMNNSASFSEETKQQWSIRDLSLPFDGAGGYDLFPNIPVERHIFIESINRGLLNNISLGVWHILIIKI